MAYKRLDYEKIKELTYRIFLAYGFTEEESSRITDVILSADLRGIESHGIQRLIRYHKAIKADEVDVHAQPETVFETPISAVIDAHGAMGQVVSYDAMERAIDMAKKSGIGIVTVRNSNHYGIAGYYALMAAKEDFMGVCMTNTEAIMVPTFSRRAMLGTNPIAVSMPADPVDFLFDAATTVVPRGKLEVYNKKEAPLPDGWAIDENGLECTDPARVLSNIINRAGGGILPLGGYGELHSGYKGYGFGMLCEIFTAIMSEGTTSNHKNDVSDTSHCFWAIDYGIFGDKCEIRQNFSRLLDEIRSAPLAEGADRIYIHGEKELESVDEKMRDGIPVNEKTFGELQLISDDLGIDYVPYIGAEF